MKYATILATIAALVQGALSIRTLQHPVSIYERKEEKLRMLMQSKPAPTAAPTKPAPAKGKGYYMKSMMMMMYKGKGMGKSSMGKGKGGSKSMMSYKGKGKSSMGKSMMYYKGKGKSSMSKGKGGSKSMMSYKGKGKSSMGKSMYYKGKGKSSMGKSMMSYKGKGKSSMGKSMYYKGKGKSSMGKSMMSYKGKGGSKSGKGSSMSYKGKGGAKSGKGSSMSYKGKGGAKSMSYKGKGKGKGAEPYMPTLADIVTESKELSTLAYALDQADLLDFFYDPAFEYTVLAPVDAAWDTFSMAFPDLYSVLFDSYWILHLVDILTMHVAEPAVFSGDIIDGLEIETFNLEMITASTSDGVCFSPSISGSSCVLLADVGASNGVAHVVDDVIKPFWLDYTVYDIVSGIPELSILASLVECSGLSEALRINVGMTVFAPTNDALKDADAEYLCSEEGVATLVDVLTFHVLPMPLPSVLIEEGESSYKTVQGSYATVTYYSNEDKMDMEPVAMYEDANILEVDYGALNGIVHIIDTIVMPPAPMDDKKSGKSGKSGGKRF